ncbi:MAG: 1-acyl-sn-glycerol-3-phosphate acyltransferase [Ardenticatenia bacterium]|nr:MAG: 1-acyl-sn-glycerol-3-phosphate acyltransferase [Ardenticatenia bacterium]
MQRYLPRFYHIANWLLRHVIFRLLLRVHVEGLHHIPQKGAFILISNHMSFLDPPLIGTYIPREVVMMSKVENFEKPIIGHIVRWYGAFPVRRGAGDIRALKQALRVLRDGQVLYLAPEGTRSPTHSLLRGKEGLALLAVQANVPVVPVAIWGQEQWRKAWPRLRRPDVYIRVGRPFWLRSEQRRPPRDVLQKLTDAAMCRLAQLLPPQYRGVYANCEPIAGDVLTVEEAMTPA